VAAARASEGRDENDIGFKGVVASFDTGSGAGSDLAVTGQLNRRFR